MSDISYIAQRRAHWDSVATTHGDSPFSQCYHQLLSSYYRFLVPPGLHVLEIGSGDGKLLNSLQPARGLGIDCSEKMVSKAALRYPHLEFRCADAQHVVLDERFDCIILSDILNDCEDVQQLLGAIRSCCHARTRIIINCFNNLWRAILSTARRLGLAKPVLEQNWLTPQDITNFLTLAGYEEIARRSYIALPAQVPVLAPLLNRFLIHCFPCSLLALTNFFVARPVPERRRLEELSVSIIIAVRNEAGHIEELLRRTPQIGRHTELIFVEGGSSDATYQTIEAIIASARYKNVSLYKQQGKGKGDAVRLGFQKATGDILLILDADMTVKPEELPRFVSALVDGKGEFINGVRLVYPMEDEAMRFFNMIGNKFFSMAFSWLLNQQIKDTLCGTKVLWREDYAVLAKNRHYFGDFDPYGDFDLIFGAAKMNLKIVDMPIRYQARRYGTTNISRWSGGWLLLKMVVFAAKRLKFI